jgi:peptide-methionine (S)-S-oxide reductase
LTEAAVFGGGCFWCTEAVFSELKGVVDVKPGYSGGAVPNPSYEQVCTGKTGHAEVVRVTFDPEMVSYDDLLEIFFTTHDPTSLNRQGADVGTQYRSVVFYSNEQQKKSAEEAIRRLTEEGVFGEKKVVTQVVPLKAFYLAEEYHHDYFKRNPSEGYCRAVISPKIAKFRSHYKDRLKSASGRSPSAF